jgi:hypothetical protein
MVLGTYSDGREVAYDGESRTYTAGGELVSISQLRADASEISWTRAELALWFKGDPPPDILVAPSSAARTKKMDPVLISFLAVVALLTVGGLVATIVGISSVQQPVQTATQPTAPPQPAPSAVTTVEPAPPAPAPEPVVETPPPPTAKTVYKAISAREFAKVCKDPDSYIGRTFILWGEVTQFDAATGTDSFRANTGPAKRRIEYGMTDYSQNSMMTGDASILSDVVAGDCFGARVTCWGSLSYDTQIGGSTTVPQFRVDAISRYGSTK